jgi:hypothetical protein
MIGLHHALAPSPRGLTPQRVAVATVAALTAAAAPTVVGAVPAAVTVVDGRASAVLVVVAVTAALSALVGAFALRAGSTLQARLRLAAGATFAGAVATFASYSFVRLLDGPGPLDELHQATLGSLFGGSLLGFLFGTLYGPVVLVAFRSRETPSHDGADRVLVAGGASLLVLGAARALVPAALPGAELATTAAAVAGALLAAVGSARIVVRAHLFARVRDGSLPGFHVIPLSGHEDEAALLPLVQTGGAPAPRGVLAATGISAPYRGARGIFKVALAPLADQPFVHPLAGLVKETLAEGGNALVTLGVGITALLVFSPVLIVVLVALL